MAQNLIREYYPFGYCPTYRTESGELEYHYSIYDDTNDKMIVFKVNWDGLRVLLKEFWCPVASNDIDYYERMIA